MRANLRRVAIGMTGLGILVGLAGVSGCTVEVGPPPPRYYYRTRIVYTASGPIYVRERVYYDPSYAPAPAYGAAPAYDPASVPPPVVESPAAAQLHPLVAPVALYSDPLIAVVLPAATFPGQVRDASAWLAAYPQPPQAAIDAQPWDASVKALVHYPTVLAQLANDLPWTQSLGSAYLNQPGDVMAAIQQMRAQAIAQGNLVNTPQQVVINDGGVIAIEPANPDVIYVPTYDPVVVYVGYHPLYFGPTYYVTGPWLVNGCYWSGGVIFVGDWHGGYYFRDGRWGHDYAWRMDRDRYWARDSRFGPAPYVDRYHYNVARDVHGREAEIHRSMTDYAGQRRDVRAHSAPDRQHGRGEREQSRSYDGR